MEQNIDFFARKWHLPILAYDDWVKDNHGSIMVVSTVITTITFQQAISPPGGLWQANVNDMQVKRVKLGTTGPFK